MSDATLNAMRATARFAFLHIDEAREHEREGILVSLIELLPPSESKLADQMLFHLREQKKAQLELAGVLDAQREPLRRAS